MNKILKPRSGCVYMWSLCQNISGLSFQPCFTCPEIWSSHGNGNRKRFCFCFFFFFELMKNKHIKLVISECAFLAKQIVLLEQGLTA